LLLIGKNITFADKSHYIVIMKNIGNTIKERRKALSITQRELAALSKVGINTLTKIERGEANPSLMVIMSILNTLGLEMDITIKSGKM